jgi:hypothetical protein
MATPYTVRGIGPNPYSEADGRAAHIDRRVADGAEPASQKRVERDRSLTAMEKQYPAAPTHAATTRRLLPATSHDTIPMPNCHHVQRLYAAPEIRLGNAVG